MGYFQLSHDEMDDCFKLYGIDTRFSSDALALDLSKHEINSVGAPKRVIWEERDTSLISVVEEVYPNIEEGERKANAFMLYNFHNWSLVEVIQFYSISGFD